MGSVILQKLYLKCPKMNARTSIGPLLEVWNGHCFRCIEELYECTINEITLESTRLKKFRN